PIDANATPKTTSASQAKKAKAPPTPARTPTQAQARKLLLPQRDRVTSNPLEERWEHTTHRTKAGDSFPLLLNRLALSQTERRLWVRSIERDFGKKPLPAGKAVHFYLSRPAGSNGATSVVQLKAVEVDYSESLNLTWEKGSWGIVFDKREKPYEIELKTVGTVVDSGLFEDATKAGIQPALISQLADIFSWDIDFYNSIRAGDSFKILYESRSRKGQETKTALRILAAELINAGEKLTAIYFEKQQGVGGYYNLDGRSLARAFLRFPLEFTSITSHFTEARFHPVLKVNVPHTGVDFAAPRGTPVRAVGDGVITQAGWNKGYGKSIEIRHDSTYSTRYAHLGRFALGIRSGTTVKKGQVIGYVGTTGRSTGPHLHFEFYKDHHYVNPLSADFPAEDEIEPALQRLFDNQKSLLLVELTSPPQS
ncbi:MAG TPA: peptidoglycan DD-metalloendopeptidase family protein, partial [Candidatus Binatia bacterium]|nr:peptidoglycan DD-metalloendopeptidase family protein [Candidatus Binatia bacterium]